MTGLRCAPLPTLWREIIPIFFRLCYLSHQKNSKVLLGKGMVLLPCLQDDGSFKSSNLSSGLRPGATARSQENTMLACVHVRGPPSDGFS